MSSKNPHFGTFYVLLAKSCGFPDHKKRQIPFLGPLEWTNFFGPSNKVVYLKKLVFQNAV